jgi:hypothetical protein
VTNASSLLLLLAVPLAWFEWRRRDRANRLLRLLGALVIAPALALIALPSGPPGGIATPGGAASTRFQSVNAPTELKLGQPLLIVGRLAQPTADDARAMLEGPSGVVDSARVSNHDPVFELVDTPRAEGGAAYRVALLQRSVVVSAETIGVAICHWMPPTLLVLDGSPSFETAWLKRWLSERGGRATIRTTVSRGRFRTEQVNGATANAARLTPALLSEYAALLADASALRALSSAERATLGAAIRDDGLGLLVTADVPAAIAAGEPLLTGLRAESAGDAAYRTARVRWNGAPRSPTVPVEVENSRLRPPRGAEALARDEADGMLAAWWEAGAGRVAVTLVRAPSRWTLEGDADRFASYWTMLLGAIARDTTTRVAVSEGRPRVNQRATIEVITTGPRPTVEVVSPDGGVDTLALARDPFDSRRLTGSYWPRAEGWHAVRLGARGVPFLVGGAAAGVHSARQHGPRGFGAGRVIGFALLLLALSGLWAESRRRLAR